MAILVDEKTKVLIQGITGRSGVAFARRMVKFGTKLVGGVSPGHSGEQVEGVPVFSTARKAVMETDANTSLVLVPAPFLKDAGLESLDAGINTTVIYTDGVPVHDAL